MLHLNFLLSEIKSYESSTKSSLLDLLYHPDFTGLLTFISLGYRCTLEEAADVLDNYLAEEQNTFASAWQAVKDSLFLSDEEHKEGDSSTVSLSKVTTLTELFTSYCMHLMSIGLSYSEFWSLSVSEMYAVSNSLRSKLISDTNRELQNYHTLALMVGGAVWGKLQKEAPQVKEITPGADTEEDALVNAFRAFAEAHNAINREKSKREVHVNG